MLTSHIGASIPLLLALWLPRRRIREEGLLAGHESPFYRMRFRRLAIALFWHLDVVGILLLIIIFAGILVPFTIAGSKPEHWKEAKVIAPLVLGLLCIPVWLCWEQKYARSSLLPYRVCCPFDLMRRATNRTAVTQRSRCLGCFRSRMDVAVYLCSPRQLSLYGSDYRF